MVRLSDYTKQRIISLRRQGLVHENIRRRLFEEDQIETSRQAISKFLKRFRETEQLKNRHGGGREAILKQVHLDFMEEQLTANNELNGIELTNLLEENYGIEVSADTVLRWRKQLGWGYGATRYCQMIREENKPKRLVFAQSCLETQDTFEDVIFTDECIVQMSSNVRRQCYKKGAPIHRRLRPKPKHPYQVK